MSFIYFLSFPSKFFCSSMHDNFFTNIFFWKFNLKTLHILLCKNLTCIFSNNFLCDFFAFCNSFAICNLQCLLISVNVYPYFFLLQSNLISIVISTFCVYFIQNPCSYLHFSYSICSLMYKNVVCCFLICCLNYFFFKR